MNTETFLDVAEQHASLQVAQQDIPSGEQTELGTAVDTAPTMLDSVEHLPIVPGIACEYLNTSTLGQHRGHSPALECYDIYSDHEEEEPPPVGALANAMSDRYIRANLIVDHFTWPLRSMCTWEIAANTTFAEIVKSLELRNMGPGPEGDVVRPLLHEPIGMHCCNAKATIQFVWLRSEKGTTLLTVTVDQKETKPLLYKLSKPTRTTTLAVTVDGKETKPLLYKF